MIKTYTISIGYINPPHWNQCKARESLHNCFKIMAPLSQPNQTYNGLNYLAVYVYYSQHIYVFMSIYKVLHWCGVHVTVSNPSKATGVK